MFKNCCASDPLDVIDRCSKPNCAGNVRRASLEPVRRFLERALLESDAYDHFATAVPWRHRIQNLRAPIEHTDASRSAHLMSRKRKEVAVQLLYIERYVSDALRRVDQC